MSVRAGIIGLGVGEAHIKGFSSHPDCKVIALCDFSEKKLAALKSKYPGMKVTSNADDIIEDNNIDVVSVASYDNFHYEQVIKSIKNNKHVFAEKPFCLYENEARQIRKALNSKKNIKMSSNLILRKSPRFIGLKKDIIEGRLGQIFCIDGDYNYGRLYKITEGWRGDIDYYSVVYGGGVHTIDLMLWLTNKKITEVCAYGTDISTKTSKFKYNDTVVSILKFADGIVGRLSANYACVYPHFHNLSVYGTKGTFVNGFDYGLFFNKDNIASKGEKIKTEYPGVHKGDLIYNFIDSIVNAAEQQPNMDEIFNSMSVCFAIEKSVKEKKPIKVDYI